MARPKRFELLTPWFVAKYSIQLSYGRVHFFLEVGAVFCQLFPINSHKQEKSQGIPTFLHCILKGTHCSKLIQQPKNDPFFKAAHDIRELNILEQEMNASCCQSWNPTDDIPQKIAGKIATRIIARGLFFIGL